MNRKRNRLTTPVSKDLKSFLENNSLENFQQEILNVENYLKRFGSLAELLSHLENVEKDSLCRKRVSQYRRGSRLSTSVQRLCL